MAGNLVVNKVQYVLASKDATGVLKLISSQNVSKGDADNIIASAQAISLKAITPFIGAKDSSKGLVISGAKAGDVVKIIARSNVSLGNNSKISLYLIHRLSQGLMFLRSQTNDAAIEGYIQICQLDPSTGRFNKKIFIDHFDKQKGVTSTALWANLSSFLAKMDQEYMDAEPMLDMLLRAVARISPDYNPRFDSTMSFELPINKIPSDILFIGGVISENGSIISVLLDKQDSYSKTIIQEGYMTDSKAKKSLLSFIDDDPFLKAAFSTTKTNLDGHGISADKVKEPEEIVKSAMISIEKNKPNDVYELNSSWLEWWILKNSH